jgi:hypothetical protein
MKKAEPESISGIKWIKLGNSSVTFFRRPTEEDIKQLQKDGLSLLVTVQTLGAEKAETLRDTCQKLGIRWINVPIPGSGVLYLKKQEPLELITQGLLAVMPLVMSSAQKCLIHCKQGLHRSALFTYSVIRLCGHDTPQAIAILREMRDKAYTAMKDFRIAYADEVLVPHVLALQSNGTEPKKDP